MAINRPLGIDEATGEDLEITPLISSTGAPDANKLVQTGSDGKLDPTLFDFDTVSITSAENITAPAFVTINGSGEVIRASAASGGQGADGFIKDNATIGSPVTVYFEGVSSGWAGLTVGANQFLSDTTPGGRTEAGSLPAGANELVQKLGRALSATEITFEPGVVRKRSA